MPPQKGAAIEDDRDTRGEAPDLSEATILAWTDRFHERTGEWPTQNSGEIPEAPGETWLLIEAAQEYGLRGLSKGATLPRLYATYRGRYNLADQNFSVEQILAWADLHQVRTGEWPLATSGRVHGGGDVSWLAKDQALRLGREGLPGGSSLGRLLAEERGVVHYPPLTEDMILGWADLHRARVGSWPACDGGPTSDAPGETWSGVNAALVYGYRGLPGGSSLALLLIKRRGHVSTRYRPRLSFRQILAWADAFRRRTGQWPTIDSGPVAEAPDETWH